MFSTDTTPPTLPILTVDLLTEDRWGTVAEWATAGVALVALLLSAGALLITLRLEKRKIYIELHDRLTSAESQEGRHILYNKLNTVKAIRRAHSRDRKTFNAANRAVGLYNTLGVYTYRKIVDRDVAFDHWSSTITAGWKTVEQFVRWRRAEHGESEKWSYLIWFAEQSGAPIAPDLQLQPGWENRQRHAPTTKRPRHRLELRGAGGVKGRTY